MRGMGRREVVGAVLAMAAVAAVGPVSPLDAQSPRERLVVDVDWLAASLDDPTLVLLHVGPRDDYATRHIPGARHVALSDIAAAEDQGGAGLSLELPAPAALESTLEGLGLGDGSRVVVYSNGSAITQATRVILTLDWFGLADRASLLDGGLSAWEEAGRPVTADVPPPAPRGDLTPRPDPDLVVTADWVAEHLDAPGYRIVDARAPVHYDGIQATYLHGEAVRKGHIPGAANLPVTSFIDDAHRLRSEEELRALFDEAGIEPGDTVVGYCHLGQFATLLLFSARTLGYDVHLYDGSFQEWGSLDRLPVELAQTPLGEGLEPAWGPDGEWILVSVLEGEQRDLFLVSPEDGARRRVTRTPESELLPTWAPDGRVAYVSPTDAGLRLFVLPDPRGAATPVAGDGLGAPPRPVDTSPLSPSFLAATWTPDGSALTVTAGDYPEIDIYRVPLDGSGPIPLVAGPGYDGTAAWSRDGRLAFVSDRAGSRDIWIRERDGAERRLTAGAGAEGNPAWSPDGRRVAYVSDAPGNREIFVIPADGGAELRVTTDPEYSNYPTWSVDGRRLAYVLVAEGRGSDRIMVTTVPAEAGAEK